MRELGHQQMMDPFNLLPAPVVAQNEIFHQPDQITVLPHLSPAAASQDGNDQDWQSAHQSKTATHHFEAGHLRFWRHNFLCPLALYSAKMSLTP